MNGRSWRLIRLSTGILFLIGTLCSALPLPAPRDASVLPSACQIRASTFEGWKAEQLSNPWVKLFIVPQLGGRVMQVVFGDHAYLFVNQQLKGKYYPPARVNQGEWFNYGGDKIWPLPEGRQDEQHWPGPISDALDAGDYEFKTVAAAPNCTVSLQGPADPQTGLQYLREITLAGNSPEISFHAVMKNVTSHPIRWSMQSVTQYDTASATSTDSYNRNFWAFAPLNPNSDFVSGYHARSGPWSDPSYSVRDGLFALHWLYLAREVWLDSIAGWLIVVDGSTSYAMVERFPHHDSEYPGKATVIFYTNGPGLEFDEQGKPFLTSSNPIENPYYMEAEVNSPMILLNPGETYALDTQWFPTRVGAEFKTVTAAGVVARPLSASKGKDGVRVSGSFGVFFAGKLVAYAFSKNGVRADAVPVQTVSPLDPVILNVQVPVPSDATRISIHLIDNLGADRGSLGEDWISQPDHGAP